MEINEVFAELKNHLNVGDLSLNKDNIFRLVFDERMIVDIETDQASGRVRLYSVIASLAQEPSSSIYKEFLSSNLQGDNNYFGIDSDARELVLFSSIDIGGIDKDGLINRLEKFVDYLEHWLNKYENGEVGEAIDTNEQSMFNDIAGNSRSTRLRL